MQKMYTELIVTILKQGSPMDYGNYKAITCTSIVFCRFVLCKKINRRFWNYLVAYFK